MSLKQYNKGLRVMPDPGASTPLPVPFLSERRNKKGDIKLHTT